jgi:hypothetical protein
VSLYLDTSCLLKTLFPEPETERVIRLVAAEERVVVSTLARLETLVQIHARGAGGLLEPGAVRSLAAAWRPSSARLPTRSSGRPRRRWTWPRSTSGRFPGRLTA